MAKPVKSSPILTPATIAKLEAQARTEDEAKAAKKKGQLISSGTPKRERIKWREDILFPILRQVLLILAPIAGMAGIVALARLL